MCATFQSVASHRSFPQCDSSFSVNKRFVVWLTNLVSCFRGLLSLETALDRLESLGRDPPDAKTAIYYDREPCSVIYVLGGMKCGVTDMSAGSPDMADSLRMWFTYHGFDWYQNGEPQVVWPAGEDAAPRWSGDLQSDVGEQEPSPFSNHVYAAALTVRGRPAAAREH